MNFFSHHFFSSLKGIHIETVDSFVSKWQNSVKAITWKITATINGSKFFEESSQSSLFIKSDLTFISRLVKVITKKNARYHKQLITVWDQWKIADSISKPNRYLSITISVWNEMNFVIIIYVSIDFCVSFASFLLFI